MPIGNGGSGAAGGTGASPTGTGLYHVVAGVMVAAAALLVNADVAAGAALDVAKLAAGANTQVLTTVGGVPTWAAPAAGGAIGGLTTQVQYNLAGAFAGSTAMTFAASQLTLTSNLLAPGVDCNTAAVLTIGGANATTVAITVAAGSGGAQLTVGSSNCLWDTAAANPYWGQALTAVASATGQPMILGAQRATGVTSIGGKLSLRSGTGTSTNGAVGIGTTGFDAWTFAGLGSASALSLTADASMTSVTYTQAATSAASGATTSFLAQTSTFAGSTGGALVLGSGAGVTLPGTVSIKVGATTQAQLGLASTDFLALGAVVATTGAIRLGNALGINVRNSANSADVSMMSLNSSNNANFGDASNAISTTVSASTVVVLSAGTEKIRAEAGGVSINGAGSYGGGVGVLCLKAATTNPTSSPTAATVIYGLNTTGLLGIYGPAGLVATTIGAAGGGTAPPVTPVTYLLVTVNGTAYKTPLYNP
jgi:hypothetical protein